MAEVELRNVGQFFRRSGGALVEVVADVSSGDPISRVRLPDRARGLRQDDLLQLVAGLTRASQGQISVDGAAIADPSPERGLVFQRDSVFPRMRTIDNVSYGLKCRGVEKTKRIEIARQYLRQVGLGDVEWSWPRELSGGMLKRVAVATVFANSPRVLLMDEPFAALDYVTKLQLHQLLLTLWEHHRPTVLFVTQDDDEAMLLADRIVVMKEGRVVDDRKITLARRRTVESLALPEAVAHKEVLLRHLELGELVQYWTAPL